MGIGPVPAEGIAAIFERMRAACSPPRIMSVDQD